VGCGHKPQITAVGALSDLLTLRGIVIRENGPPRVNLLRNGTTHAHFRLRHRLSDRLRVFWRSSSAVADTAPVQVVTPDTTQSSHQPTSGPILQQQNQTGGAQKRLQEAAEEGNDLLNVLD